MKDIVSKIVLQVLNGYYCPLLRYLKLCFFTDKPIKEQKIENFFGSDFEFCTISLLVVLADLGYVKEILLGYYWGRYNCSSQSETKQNS